MTEANKKVLATYKRANKDRKLKMIKKAGFETEAGFLVSLGLAGEANTSNNVKPTIHNVYILDASGSMTGGKFTNALAGINAEIEELKNNTEANFTQTIVDFAESYDIKTNVLMKPIREVGTYKSNTRGSTALYQAIGETLTQLKNSIKTGEKVLVKIFTDGGENASRGEFANSNVVQKLIKECESIGFTVTFVGTKTDVDNVQHKLSIDVSNMLVHDNTSVGVKMSFQKSTRSTVSYASKVANGEDVLTGFYKQKSEL